MLEKVKQLIYIISLLFPIALNANNEETLLHPKLWKEALCHSPYLAKTEESLTRLVTSNPLFFADLAPQILEEGLKKYSHKFIESNPHFIFLLLQDFEQNHRITYRTELLKLAQYMNKELQKTFFSKELNFLLKINPKEYRLRTREIKNWIKLSQKFPETKLALLMVYERSKEPAVRHFLSQAIKQEKT